MEYHMAIIQRIRLENTIDKDTQTNHDVQNYAWTNTRILTKCFKSIY